MLAIKRKALRTLAEHDRVGFPARPLSVRLLLRDSSRDRVFHLGLQHTQRCLRLCHRDTRLQPAHHPEPVHVRAVPHFRAPPINDGNHGERRKDVDRIGEEQAAESLLRDADDLERIAVHREFLPNDFRICRESPLPVVVRENRDGAAARLLVVFGCDQAATRGSDPERLEVRTGYQVHLGEFDLARAFRMHAGLVAVASREEAGEDLVAIAEFAIEGISLDPGAFERDELLWFGDW